MDEPFSALDAITREEARELFLMIWEQNRPTTILVTHSIEEALYLGNKIIVMGSNNGEIKYQMFNPYFGKIEPKSKDFIETKQLLREQLKTEDKRVGKFGKVIEAM
jgi:NitT/TauT family transport system ATP-binding protein